MVIDYEKERMEALRSLGIDPDSKPRNEAKRLPVRHQSQLNKAIAEVYTDLGLPLPTE
ncbi:hypothetical protein IOQ59_07515 [Pontibacterium sp. N1Y112]|uniref:Uncharacterized protein n=1 Tax=Pontibacterium sinense TaxID=2781979 RepID=A0A8J7FJ56_9GAMM|nr:hypothetical protein [Pontibacterium sinense]MBE9397108.1 hypothetical protein [Pontibacterium sinense]